MPAHDVLTLSVDQKLAVELPLTRGRVARKADASPRGFAEIAEHHCLDVDGRAEVD